jgi:hypothetical protein
MQILYTSTNAYVGCTDAQNLVALEIQNLEMATGVLEDGCDLFQVELMQRQFFERRQFAIIVFCALLYKIPSDFTSISVVV